MARLILFSAGCLTANLPSFCQPHSWSLIRHCARTVVAAGGHLVCLHSPATKWPPSVTKTVGRNMCDAQQHHTCHVSRTWSRWTNVLWHLTSSGASLLVSGCRLSDRLTAWDLMTRTGPAPSAAWGGGNLVQVMFNRHPRAGEQWLTGARLTCI